MCGRGRGHFGDGVCPRPQILRPRPRMFVNGVRAQMLYIQVQISGEGPHGPHGEMEDKQKSRF